MLASSLPSLNPKNRSTLGTTSSVLLQEIPIQRHPSQHFRIMFISICDPDNIQTDSSARIVSSLERLPAEVLEKIVLYTKINHKRNVHAFFFTHVETMRFRPRPLAADLTNLRMTCRTIEAKLRYTFERICFGKIILEFNKKGLRDLQRVASHASSSKAVHTLSFMRPSKWSGEFSEEDVSLCAYHLRFLQAFGHITRTMNHYHCK